MPKQYEVTITDKVAPGVPVVSLEAGGRKSLMDKAKPAAIQVALEDHEAEQLTRDGYEVKPLKQVTAKGSPDKKADSNPSTTQKSSDGASDGAAGGAK